MTRETASATASLPLLPGRVERVWLWLAVASLHGLLLLAVRDALLPRQPDAATTSAAPPLVVRMIVPVPVPVPRAAPPDATRPVAQAAPPRRPPAEPRIEAVRAVGEVGQAITTAPMVAEASPAASAPDTQPLNLSVPRAIAVPAQPSMRDQMINDLRSNSARATVESRVAAVAGTDVLVEERMDATRTRVRQRGQCVEVHESRAAQLDPWNQSHSPTPKIVKPSC